MAHIKENVVLRVRRQIDNLIVEVRDAYFDGVAVSARHHGVGKSDLRSMFTTFQDVIAPVSYVARKMVKRQNIKYKTGLRTSEQAVPADP